MSCAKKYNNMDMKETKLCRMPYVALLSFFFAVFGWLNSIVSGAQTVVSKNTDFHLFSTSEI